MAVDETWERCSSEYVQASAIQPVEAKVAKLGFIPIEYPAVVGGLVSGTIEALGSGVNGLEAGRRVVSETKILTHRKAQYGGLQRFAVVDASRVISIGDVSFETALTLASDTPVGALFDSSTLGLTWPTIPASPLPASEQGKKILIWGGSSAMGSLAISYAKQAGYTVISTSSSRNFELLKSLGADYILDHSDPTTPKAIRSLFPIDYWFDAISVRSSVSAILEALTSESTGEPVTKANILLLLPPAWLGIQSYPEGVTVQFHQSSTFSPKSEGWREHFFAADGFIEQSIKGRLLRGVPAEVIGGLEKAEEGIDMVFKGVSGRKIVIQPWSDGI